MSKKELKIYTGDIKLLKEDRIELLKYVNLLSRSVDKASELFDLELSDLRNLSELQWKLFHKLELTHNEERENRYEQPFILREDKKDGDYKENE